MSRFINLFTDFGFKKLFGEEANKDICIDLLNTLIFDDNIYNLLPNLPNKIVDIIFSKNEYFGDVEDDRKIIIDLICKTQSGETIIIEMQKAKQRYFKDRALFYACRVLQEQGIKRMENDPSKTWDYKLKPLYLISIMDFTFDDSLTPGNIIHNVMLKELEQDVVFYDKLRFIYLEMPNFTKKLEDLETHLDKWFYLFRNISQLDEIPPKLQEKIFVKLFKEAEIANYTPQQQQYQESLKQYMDLHNALQYAQEVAEEKGMEKGMEKGFNQAMEKIDEKVLEGKLEKSFEIAQNMKKQGFTLDVIVAVTGLTKEQVGNL